MKNSITGKILTGNWKGGWALDKHMAIFPKRTEIGEMLYQLKYNKDKSRIEPLANKAYEFMKTRYVTKWLFCIVPVPPSDTNRAFQPVIEIAKLLGKKLNIPVNYDCLQKIKTTEFMKDNDISAKEKEEKLKGVFKINNKILKNKKILLFDDVCQTGSTLKEITRVLYNEGDVQDVFTLTITKTTTKKDSI
ncbi:phosphoribosyl transferase family protein [alpha proteobacterium HIMB5]|nr:phosphoribosyl transferase family protein [alpha proteobacterium HIMB5]